MKALRFVYGVDDYVSWVEVSQSETNEAIIEELYVDPDERGRGVGYGLIESTCKDADDEGVTLYVTPLPFGSYDKDADLYYPPGVTYKQLCKFYRRFGFRFKSKKDNVMMRRPRR